MTSTDRAHSPTPEELMAYLDGESTAGARASIEAHVTACADCRRVISDLSAVNRAVGAWRIANAPPTLRPPRVVSAKAGTLRALSWRPGYFAVSFASAVATFVLVGGLAGGFKHTLLRYNSPAALAAKVTAVDGTLDGRLNSNGAPPSGGSASVDVTDRRAPETKPVDGLMASTREVPAQSAGPRQPAVIRTATLRLVASDFNDSRARVESIVAQTDGFIDQVTVNGGPGTARVLTGTLRVPSNRLGDALAKLRQLGQVTEDTLGSEDVTDQVVDLDTRLANARATEQRLSDILKNRTGKLSDVLQVEREISRVRLEIEQMDAERVNMGRRVAYAAITLEIDELRRAGLGSGPLSLPTRLRVAGADGVEAAIESIVAAVLFVLRTGPALVLWVATLSVAWLGVRRFRIRASRTTEG